MLVGVGNTEWRGMRALECLWRCTRGVLLHLVLILSRREGAYLPYPRMDILTLLGKSMPGRKSSYLPRERAYQFLTFFLSFSLFLFFSYSLKSKGLVSKMIAY